MVRRSGDYGAGDPLRQVSDFRDSEDMTITTSNPLELLRRGLVALDQWPLSGRTNE